jgi:hypothetical protein
MRPRISSLHYTARPGACHLPGQKRKAAGKAASL